jgi:hypothetical protein
MLLALFTRLNVLFNVLKYIILEVAALDLSLSALAPSITGLIMHLLENALLLVRIVYNPP